MLRIQRLLWCYFMWGGASLCCAQTSPDTYWVAFTDKDATPYSLQTPEAFLSPRAIQRRLAQGIALDEMDLPVDPAYVAQVETVEGAEVLNRSKWLNGVVVQVLDSTVRDAILELPCVATVHMVGSGARVLDRPDKFGTPRTVADRELDTVLYGNA